MLVPDGVTAAAVGSSVIWKIVVAPSKIEAWPSTWKVNTGAPITTTRSCVAQRVRELARRGVQEAGELRMPFRETSSAPRTG